ncbi:hypothetical protein D3C78_726350 [compost metagenome]
MQLALLLQFDAPFAQLSNHRAIVCVLEEAVDLVGDLQTDVRQPGQHLGQRGRDARQRTQGTGQQLGGFLADIGDTEGEDEARQRRLPARRDGRQQVAGGQLGEAFQAHHLLEGQGVEVGRRLDQPHVHQLLDDLVAQAVDVHGAPRDEVDDRLLELRLAAQAADAAIDRTLAERGLALAALDQLGTLDVRAAYRARLRNRHGPRIGRTALEHHLHHLRNHVAGAADDHRIADHQPQARHLVHVVQGGVGHGDASHLHRSQARHRGHRTGATDLELDVEQLGQLLLGGKLVGDGPAWLAGAKAQLALPVEAVDLEHHAVDLVGQAVALGADRPVVAQRLLDATGQLQFVTDRQPPALEGLENAGVGIRQLTLELTDTVGTELQRATGGHLRIELAQAAGGGIARIGEGLAAGLDGPRIQRLEAGARHEHLAAHLQHARPALAVQAQGDVAHGAHIAADVLTGTAVATGGATHQHTVLVEQADRQAVELGLAGVFHQGAGAEQVAGRQQLAQPLAYPTVEVAQVVFREGVAEAEHGNLVAHLAERTERLGADALGRRVAADQLGMRLLQRLQFLEQAIVFGIRHARLVEHVVAIVVLVDGDTQLLDALGGSTGHGAIP